MAVKGGGDRRDLRPLDQPEELLGSHRGSFEALNVRNPQPGRHYKYVRADHSAILTELNKGYEFIREGDPESWGMDVKDMPPRVQASLDSLRRYQDVILMWTPVENFERLQREHVELSRARRDAAESEYLSAGEQLAAGMSSAARPENPLYYKRRDHQTVWQEEKE